MISLRPVAVKWTGVLLLCASLCLDILHADNAAFAIVFWILGLGFTVIVAALVQTGRKMAGQRGKGARF